MVSSISSIYIHCPTFTTFNISSKEGGHTDVIQKIPVNSHVNNILVWENVHNFKSKISEKNVTDIEIILTDENNNPIEIPDNCHWTGTIQLDFINKPKFLLFDGLNKTKLKRNKISTLKTQKKIINKNAKKNIK